MILHIIIIIMIIRGLLQAHHDLPGHGRLGRDPQHAVQRHRRADTEGADFVEGPA